MSQKISQPGVFTGAYVADILQVLTASAISNTNAIVISPPGFGKTEIFSRAAHEMTGGQWNFTALTPSSPPTLIEGVYNPAEFLKGNMVRRVEGTAMDPRNRVVILDEIGRASEPTYDSLLHAVDRKDVPANQRPVFWATANFVLTDERTEALRDRIGLWMHVRPVIHDQRQMLDSFREAFTHDLQLALPQAVPSWDEIVRVRACLPGPRAHNALADFIQSVCEEIAQPPEPENPNPRHLRQWYNTLFRYSVFLKGTENFTEVAAEAKKLVRYLWVQPTVKEWEAWGKKTRGVSDFVGAIIAAVQQHTIGQLNELIQKTKARGKGDEQNMVMQATAIIQSGQKEITQKCGDDDRAKKAKAGLQKLMIKVASGESIAPNLDL